MSEDNPIDPISPRTRYHMLLRDVVVFPHMVLPLFVGRENQSTLSRKRFRRESKYF